MDAKFSSSLRGWDIMITAQSKRSSHSTFKWTVLWFQQQYSRGSGGRGNEHKWQMSGWEILPLQFPIIILPLLALAASPWNVNVRCWETTTWGEAAETGLLFQVRWVILPPTAWQGNTNFLLWLCAWLAATLLYSLTWWLERNKTKTLCWMGTFKWRFFFFTNCNLNICHYLCCCIGPYCYVFYLPCLLLVLLFIILKCLWVPF